MTNKTSTQRSPFAGAAPALASYTDRVLFGGVWKRPQLAPRDRSLVTLAALVSFDQTTELPFYLNRALDNDLTQVEAGEVLTQLAFYTGWPRVFSALPVFKQVFEERTASHP